MRGSLIPARIGRLAATVLFSLALGAALLVPVGASASEGLFFGEGSHIRMDLLDDRADVLEVLHVRNDGDVPAEPPGGLILGLPAGAERVRGDREVLLDPTHGTVSIPGPFPPGETVVRLGFSLPVVEGRVSFRQRMGTAAEAMHLLLPEVEGMKILGESVLGVDRRRVEGLSLLLVELEVRGDELSFSLEGLPRRTEVARWIALALAAALLAAGLVMGSGGKRPDETPAQAEREKRLILDELEQLELDKREGIIGEADYACDREELMERLAAALEAIEEARLEGES